MFESHWFLRLTRIIVFILSRFDKIQVDIETAESFGLTYLVWWVVAYGELGAGIGLLVGGLLDAIGKNCMNTAMLLHDFRYNNSKYYDRCDMDWRTRKFLGRCLV